MCERGEIERGCVCRIGFVFLREMDIFAAVSVCICSYVGVCMSDYVCVCVVCVRACLKSENSNKKSSEYLNSLILFLQQQVKDIPKFLTTEARLPCCGEQTTFLRCVPGQQQCPNCSAPVRLSWCFGQSDQSCVSFERGWLCWLSGKKSTFRGRDIHEDGM